MSWLAAQQLLRSRLMGDALPECMPGLDKPYRQLHELLYRSIAYGQSNSVLLNGARGSGKSLVLQRVLEQLQAEPELDGSYVVIYLNGLVQTDTRLALRSIAHQLNQSIDHEQLQTGSFSECLSSLLTALKCGGSQQQSVIFVLDEFQEFTDFSDQRLLYNLFDVAQAIATPLTVVAISAHVSVLELLEKRVRSRFSQRSIYFRQHQPFSLYLDICRALLFLPSSFSDVPFRDAWNKHVHECVLEDQGIRDSLQYQHELSHSIWELRRLLSVPICHITEEQPLVPVATFLQSLCQPYEDGKMTMLRGLTLADICLLVSMLRLSTHQGHRAINFEIAYHDYTRFAAGRIHLVSKTASVKAFEQLLLLRLISWDSQHSRRGAKHVPKLFRPICLCVSGKQIRDIIQNSTQFPSMELLRAANALTL